MAQKKKPTPARKKSATTKKTTVRKKSATAKKPAVRKKGATAKKAPDKKAAAVQRQPAARKATASTGKKKAAKKTTSQSTNIELIDVTADNVEQTGFFCMMSKKKSDGYQRKLRWLQARFQEGLRIKMLPLPERGFIEYIPGDYAWRPIADAGEYFFIHCLWVVGKSRGQGFARLLLDVCVEDARRSGRRGVAMITSEGNWLISRKMLESYGFKSVEQYTGDSLGPFDLMVLPFKNGKSPTFTGHLKKSVSRAAPGFTVVRSDQCPYLSDATEIVRECARELKVPFRIVDLQSAADVRAQSASPYGVFQILFNGRILSYHYELKKDLLKKAIATQNAPG